MSDLTDSPLLIALAVIAALVLLFLLFRPRQRVRLSDEGPVRPHMIAGEGKGVADEAAAAANA